MPLITLLKPGSLVAYDQTDKLEQEKLDEIVPIDYVMEWFQDRQNSSGLKNRILVLKSDTGSGKSTAFPAILYKIFFKKVGTFGTPDNIIITQPKVMNAITIVRDQVAGSEYYPFMVLGETIGWQTGPSKKKPRYGLLYATLGVLVEQMKTLTDEQLMQKYRYIIIDEVHEASLEQSLLLMMLKNFMNRNANNPNLPFLTLTSATFNTIKFLKYFGVYDETPRSKQPNLIQVRGFAYELEERWTLEHSTANYITTIYQTIAKIHTKDGINDTPDNADILVFLPSLSEMLDLQKLLQELTLTLIKQDKPLFKVLQIDSEAIKKNKIDFYDMSRDINELRVILPNEKLIDKIPVRRIILSTSVAETGVTIDTLKYVIDSGFYRGPEYNPHYNVSGVVTKTAQHSRIKQRKGRANRKSPGVFYPMYPKYVYDSLQPAQLADIEISDISGFALSLFKEQIRSGNNLILATKNDIGHIDHRLGLDMIDLPPEDTMHDILWRFYRIGYVSPYSDYTYIEPTENYLFDVLEKIENNTLLRQNTQQNTIFGLTKLGAIAANFSFIGPEQLRIIFASYAWNIPTIDLVTIAAYLSIELKSKDKPNWAEIYENAFDKSIINGFGGKVQNMQIIVSCDFINGLILYNAVNNLIDKNELTSDLLQNWCEKNNILYLGIIEFIKIRDSILDQMVSFGLDPFYKKSESIFSKDYKPNKLEIQQNFINYITAIKYCIYEGYKCNMALLNPKTDKYFIKYGNLEINTPDLMLNKKIKSNYILYDKLSFKLNKKTEIYEIKTGRICSLDGYVKIC